MGIIIGADVVPTNRNIKYFEQGDVEKILGNELLSIWDSSDLRLFNLEVPLVDSENPIFKQGPNLIAPKSTINGIKKLNPSLVTLANNHILDQDDHGLNSTIDLLTEYSIDNIGAGNNLFEASEPYIINWGSKRIGIYACAEHEFTIATEESPGANPFDPLESLDHIAKLKNHTDYIIVLYHGGKEHYRYPTPYLQKVCRKIIEKGADLIVCQHSHCVGSYEEYNEGTIVYGQGNFVFNKKNNEFWNTSLLTKLNDDLSISFIPIKRNEIGVELAEEKEANEILNGFNLRSREIMKKDFVKEKYAEFAYENIPHYIRSLSGFGKWKGRLDRRIFKNNLARNYYSEKEMLAIQNYIECEAHRELLLEGLKVKGK